MSTTTAAGAPLAAAAEAHPNQFALLEHAPFFWTQFSGAACSTASA